MTGGDWICPVTDDHPPNLTSDILMITCTASGAVSAPVLILLELSLICSLVFDDTEFRQNLLAKDVVLSTGSIKLTPKRVAQELMRLV